MKRNHTMSLITRTVTTILAAFGLLFSASGTVAAEVPTALEVSQSSKGQVAEPPLTPLVDIAGGADAPGILAAAGPFLTRSECKDEQKVYEKYYDYVSDCYFDVPSRAFYFNYEDI
jgi:hypothetical protein